MALRDEALYLGFDLSTQQLKAIVISSSLKVLHEAKVDFDADLSHHGITKGVHINPTESEVYAPVAMWIEALDLVLSRLKTNGAALARIRGISGAGQQHGSVFWSARGVERLGTLQAGKSLVEQLSPEGFSHPWSPNWQDGSTQRECDEFDAALGGEDELAHISGSKAHHRFTGPQIMRFKRLRPEIYAATARISLVSSFLASLLLGKIASIDISDVCGMNLWDIDTASWSEPLLKLTAGENGAADLKKKLGEVRIDGGGSLGSISDYFVERYGFDKSCQIAPFTGDNPSTILALPLRPLDAIVSLGTSTTFLMSTPKYVPNPAYHFFNHPTTSGLCMFMLCYKNGGLAREKIRDSLPKASGADPWGTFNETVTSSRPLGRNSPDALAKLGLYFPLPEIVPNVRAGTWRYNSRGSDITEATDWNLPATDARAIVESQILSMKLRSQPLVNSPSTGLPPQPRRIYLVGGGSLNPVITKLIGEILGGSEGVYKLDVGGNSCALGGAYKAVWAIERKEGESFESLIGNRWNEEASSAKVDEGYRSEVWSEYDDILPAFERMEKEVLAGEERLKRKAK